MSRLISAIGTMVLVSCGSPILEPASNWMLQAGNGLTYRVTMESRSSHDPLVWVGSIENASDEPIEVRFGACGLDVEAVRPEGLDRVWRSDARAPYEYEGSYFCPDYLAVAELEPGEAMAPEEFQLTVPVNEFLGDSLSEGRYEFSAWFEHDGQRIGPVQVGAATIED